MSNGLKQISLGFGGAGTGIIFTKGVIVPSNIPVTSKSTSVILILERFFVFLYFWKIFPEVHFCASDHFQPNLRFLDTLYARLASLLKSLRELFFFI